MTEWSGVVDAVYGTVVLTEPDSPPDEALDVDRLMKVHCARITGGIQIELPDQNPNVPTQVRVLDEPTSIEDEWEHVAEIGFRAPGGRLWIYTWLDEPVAGEIDVPTEPLVARIHWAGLGAWYRLVMAGRHLEASEAFRLRIDLVCGTVEGVRTVRAWDGWARNGVEAPE